jgi:cellulose synthase/poly-beta-1,6-N-acetylglucosamine synthase-like glycosyltransferase
MLPRSKPKVSVVMPCCNHGSYLSEAIESVLSQSYREVELIVVDDFSRDDSAEILREWQSRDPRVIAIYSQENQGPSESRNKAIDIASGHFVGFCDADDIWNADKLEMQIAALSAEPNVGVVYSNAAIIDSAGKPTGEDFASTFGIRARKQSGYLFGELCRASFICASSVVVRRNCLEAAGRFDKQLRYLQDWTCWLRISRKHTFMYIPELLLGYRVHDRSTSLDSRGYETDRIIAANLILNEFPDLPAKVRSDMFGMRGLSEMALGQRQDAHLSFAESVRARPANVKSIVRWCQTI